jgi:hypothetical protein
VIWVLGACVFLRVENVGEHDSQSLFYNLDFIYYSCSLLSPSLHVI